MRPTLALIALLTGWSCSSGGPVRPEGGTVEARSGYGRVLCGSLDQIGDAAKCALAIDEYFRLAGTRLGRLRLDPVEIWLIPGWKSTGTTFERCIVFDPSDGAINIADPILTHEFVHWHLDGSAMQKNLPHTVLEGVCDRIAADLVPNWEEVLRDWYGGLLESARERGELPLLISSLGLDKFEWYALRATERKYELYALGFALVDRIGIDTLREAAERGPVTPDEVLELAGIGADGAGLELRPESDAPVTER